MDDRIYTIQQAADFLSVCTKTLRKEIAAGNVATFSLGAGRKRPIVRIRHQALGIAIRADQMRADRIGLAVFNRSLLEFRR